MRVILSAATYGLAWFTLVNAAASMLAWLFSLRVQDRVIADTGRSRRLLAIRFLPFAASAIVSLALFVPAHLRFEPAQTGETFGMLALTVACLGWLLLVRAGWRGGRLLIASTRLTRSMRRTAAAEPAAPWLELPLLHGIALAGVLSPRVLIGSETRRVLSPRELEVAVAHELAHRRAMDNFTRVALQCLPDFFGLTPAARRLERLWDAQAECLADARAVDGSPDRATHLASALVKVARLDAPHMPSVVAWSTFHQAALLETRVRLLVEQAPGRVDDNRGFAGGATLIAAAVIGAWATGVPHSLHWLTEIVVATLP